MQGSGWPGLSCVHLNTFLCVTLDGTFSCVISHTQQALCYYSQIGRWVSKQQWVQPRNVLLLIRKLLMNLVPLLFLHVQSVAFVYLTAPCTSDQCGVVRHTLSPGTGHSSPYISPPYVIILFPQLWPFSVLLWFPCAFSPLPTRLISNCSFFLPDFLLVGFIWARRPTTSHESVS